MLRTVAPSDTDAAIDQRSGPHVAAVPTSAERIGRLLVFYPGTGARPEQYTSFIRRTAERGYHAIGLDYENSQSINFDVCPNQPPECPEQARLEILTGTPSPYIRPDVDVANSAFNRLARLLRHQAQAQPGEGWDAYLTPGGEPNWSRIAFAGHSQGGGHAAMTARLHDVPRVILLGATEPSAWTETPFATDAARFLGLVHDREPIRNGVLRSWDNLRIPGATVTITTSPPPVLVQRMITAAEGCGGDPQASGYYHNCYIVDEWMPAAAADGTPAFAEIWDHLLTAAIDPSPTGPGKVARLTPDGESWLDPEVLRIAAEAWISWQDPHGGIWVAGVDLLDGTVARPPLPIGASAAPLGRTFNGPEFGLDINGWALYYTQLVGGIEQAARTDRNGTTAVITRGEGHFSPLPTRNAGDASTRLLMLRRPPEWGTLLWIDAEDPAMEHSLSHLADREDGDARWAEGTAVFATNAHPDHSGQVTLVDTRTGEVTVVTDTTERKTTPYAWRAPESAAGELFVLAVVGETRLEVWAPDAESGWRSFAVIESPSAEHPYIGSPEPFVAGGRSYISLTVRDTSTLQPGITDAQVWLLGVDPGLQFRQRCDDAAAGPIMRADPESLAGAKQVFVYYYAVRQTSSEVWRCASGIAP